jgi:hypothetical protein
MPQAVVAVGRSASTGTAWVCIRTVPPCPIWKLVASTARSLSSYPRQYLMVPIMSQMVTGRWETKWVTTRASMSGRRQTPMDVPAEVSRDISHLAGAPVYPRNESVGPGRCAAAECSSRPVSCQPSATATNPASRRRVLRDRPATNSHRGADEASATAPGRAGEGCAAAKCSNDAAPTRPRPTRTSLPTCGTDLQ